MALPLTDKNFYLHIRLAHSHMVFGRQYKQGPPNMSIIEYGWEVKDGMTSFCIDVCPLAIGPQHLVNVKKVVVQRVTYAKKPIVVVTANNSVILFTVYAQQVMIDITLSPRKNKLVTIRMGTMN